MSVAEVNLTHSVINTNFNIVFPENIYKNSQIKHNSKKRIIRRVEQVPAKVNTSC